jgi:hypothetical protein
MAGEGRARSGGRRLGLLGALAALVLLGAVGWPVRPGAAPESGPAVAQAASVQRLYGALPLRFEPNVGQADAAAQFVARGAGYTLLLGPNEAVLALRAVPGAATVEAPAAVLRLQLVGADVAAASVGEARLPGVAHYYLGDDPAGWHTDVPTYGQVRYRDVYDGIDLLYYGSGGELEYDFLVAPGAEPARIRLRFPGAESVAVDARGELVLRMAGAEVRQRPPVAYQERDGARQAVEARYVLLDGAETAAPSQRSALSAQPSVGVALGAYDHGRPLVIDPVLVYSTYLGGSALDEVFGIALDSAGNAYVAGVTASMNFPAFNGSQLTYGGGAVDAFVAKLSPTGTIVYSTYLGGNNEDVGYAIAADASGNAYVAGYTQSTNFPTTAGAYDTTLGPDSIGPARDAFVAKLTTTGTRSYATYLGGNGGDVAYGIAVDTSGNASVTGETISTNFPTLSAVQPTPGSLNVADAFVTKLNSTGSALVYSTYLGGNAIDRGRAIAVDTGGNAYVTGETYSVNFPTANALQSTYGGGTQPRCGVGFNPPCPDVFVTKLTAAGNAFGYSTYLGGNDADYGRGIAVDTGGNAYVTGQSFSTQFPRTAIFGDASAQFAFVTKLVASGALGYSVLLGGLDTSGQAVAVDGTGSAYVTGYTRATNFPTQDPLQATLTSGQGSDVFVSKVNAAGSALVYSTYLGGSSSSGAVVDEAGFGIAVDGSGNAYVAGFTQATDFPTRNPWQPMSAGSLDAFVTKLNDATPTPTLGATLTPTITRMPTITPSPTATLLPVSCAPRPNVVVTSAPGAPGSLQVTVQATGANNLLLALRFDDPRPSANALIDVGGQTGRTGAFTVALPPPGVPQTQFTVRRGIAGLPATVHFTVVDRCGDWQTLAGGGGTAF